MADPKKRKAVERGRDAKTGEFIPVAEARRRKATAIVQRIRLPGKKKK